MPLEIPLTLPNTQITVTNGGGYNGPQAVGPQTPNFTDVQVFTGNAANGGLPGATCFSWVSTGAGDQQINVTYTGFDGASHFVNWDIDNNGNPIEIINAKCAEQLAKADLRIRTAKDDGALVFAIQLDADHDEPLSITLTHKSVAATVYELSSATVWVLSEPVGAVFAPTLTVTLAVSLPPWPSDTV